MRSERRKKVMTLSILAVCVLTISIGFAAFSSTLNVKTSASVNPDASKFGVIFSSDGNSTSTTQTVNPNSSTYGDAATITNGINPVISGLSAKFTNPGDSVTYTFYAKNTGEYLAYLNYITFIGSKTCTPGSGTTQSLVDSACNGISMSVKVGNDAAVTGSTSLISNHTLAAGTSEQVVVTISYAEDAQRADGSFTVTFGDIMLTYSSVADYVAENESSNTYVIYRNSDEWLSIGDSIDTITEYETSLSNISEKAYLKHEIENNIVTASYACLTYTENGTRKDVCLQGGDESYYASNQAVLRSIESYIVSVGGSCTFDDSNSSCDVGDEIDAVIEFWASSDGAVGSLDEEGETCSVGASDEIESSNCSI